MAESNKSEKASAPNVHTETPTSSSGGQGREGGKGGVLKSNTQSVKICLNFNFQGGGGCSEVKYSKCQDLPKFQWGGGVLKSNTQSAKICLNLNYQGGGYSEVKYSKCQDLPIFQFSGGGGRGTLEPNSRTGVFWSIWTEIYCLRSTVQKPASASQIVSHILRMWRLITDFYQFHRSFAPT